MGKEKKILSVEFDFPGNLGEYVPVDEARSLSDADIVVIQPHLNHYSSKTYLGKPWLSEHFSFKAREASNHWNKEIFNVLQTGKTVFVFLRGLDQMMYDMYDDPQLLHRMMAFLRDDTHRELDLYETEGVLSLNNGPDDYVGSGGVGCTDELPAEGFDGKVRCKDMWGHCESQETVGVGPEQFEEFVLPYQLPLMKRFGLICYGCCEPVDKRLDMLLRDVPNLRRVSISPWSDRKLAAEKLAGRAIFSWKPNPALVCTPKPDWDEVERVTRETVEIARGCCLEMVLKDTHTFCNDPDRVGKWVQTVRRIIEET